MVAVATAAVTAVVTVVVTAASVATTVTAANPGCVTLKGTPPCGECFFV